MVKVHIYWKKLLSPILASANPDGLTVAEIAAQVRASGPAAVREFSEANLIARIQKALTKNSQTYGEVQKVQWVRRGSGAGVTQRFVIASQRPAPNPPPREGDPPIRALLTK